MRRAIRITAAALAALVIWTGASVLADGGDDATAVGTVRSEQSSDTGTSSEFQWKRAQGLNVR